MNLRKPGAAIWRPRRWLLANYAAVAAVFALLTWVHEPPEQGLDGLDRAMIWTIVAVLGGYWLVTLVRRVDWPAQTIGLHNVILGDVVLYGVVALGWEWGWLDQTVAANLLRACVWVGALVLGAELVRWLWAGRPRRRRRRL